jgi:hypothetical protein
MASRSDRDRPVLVVRGRLDSLVPLVGHDRLLGIRPAALEVDVADPQP